MNKKLFKLGMLVVMLVFGLMFVGCGEHEFAFVNNSSHTVTVRCDDLSPPYFMISAGETINAASSKRKVEIQFIPANLVRVTTSGGRFTFSNM